jgi:soluble lytic murein transglycosylase-like protein
MYPENIRQWCELVIQVVEQYDMDANLIAAVMLQESGGNPRAYSKSGAVGLLQVMPKDGIAASFTCINGPCFANRPSSDELFDPAFNLQYGVRMLAGLQTRYGNLRDALKAYGPMDMGYHYADKVLSIYQNYQ